MKALPIIWRWPKEFERHIILIGPFHTAMNYIGMVVGHKMKGSGYEDIIVEAELVSSGSLKGVLSGKGYAKSLFCLKVVTEALERLLIQVFLDEEDFGDWQMLEKMRMKLDRESLDSILESDSCVMLLEKYVAFQQKVLDGYLGKTAAFWMSFIKDVHLLLMLLFAVKTNNFPLFRQCNGDMAKIFFAFGGQNYSR